MRKLFITCIITMSLGASAQWGTKQNPNPTPVSANRLVLLSESTMVAAFNEELLKNMPLYHLVSLDTSKKQEWNFEYKNGDDILTTSYKYQFMGADPDMKIKGVNKVNSMYVSGHFLTMLDVYNALFTPAITAEQFKEHGNKIGAPVNYNGKDKFAWLVFSRITNKPGYYYIRVELQD